MTPVTTRRDCPYCGDSLVLGALPIVATNYDVVERGDTTSETRRVRRSRPKSGAPVSGHIGELPIVAEPPLPKAADNFWPWLLRQTLRNELPGLATVASPQDLPARVCTSCETPLPEDLDDRDAFVVAVVGTVGAGKSHFLASMLDEAARRQRLSGVGCREFVLDEKSSGRYENEYFDPVFRGREQLRHTMRDPEVVRKPLVCRVWFENAAPALLFFHDIAGESLTDRTKRATDASFLRRADAVILLIDPVCLDRPDGGRTWEDDGIGDLARTSQADLLNAVAHEMAPRTGVSVPIVVTVSKSDLLRPFAPPEGWEFLREPDTGSIDPWDESLRKVDTEVQEFLAAWRAEDILAATRLLDPAQVTFRAVAPFGGRPDPGSGRLPVLAPLRCLDPLITVLYRLRGLVGPG